MTIADLDKIVASLTPKERRLFQRIFQFSVVSGRLRPPSTMHPWIEKHFGAVKEVAEQRVVKVTNVITFEGALFNMLRGRRPIDVGDGIDIGDRVLEEEDHPCLLQDAMSNTPEDIFGRVKGESCITASNIAKYDAFHGLVVFQEHNPLRFSREAIIDYLETGWRWAEKAHELDSSAKYYFFMWNCLWKAGASLVHGHAQVLLSHDTHYAKIEALRRAALRYRAEYGADYFEDLYRVHFSLGLGLEREGVRIISSLSPIKARPHACHLL